MKALTPSASVSNPISAASITPEGTGVIESGGKEHVLSIAPDGTLRFIYNDALAPLLEIGLASTVRASHVEPAPNGQGWCADLSPVDGPLLGAFPLRQQALDAEVVWLLANRI